MSLFSRPTSPSPLTYETLQRLAHWCKHHGHNKAWPAEPRHAMIQRYPAGLLSEAELDALLDYSSPENK